MTWAERNILPPYSVEFYIVFNGDKGPASEDEVKDECRKRGWHFECAEDEGSGLYLVGIPPEIEAELEEDGFYTDIQDREFRAGSTIQVGVTIEMPFSNRLLVGKLEKNQNV